jgi:alpha-D-xyloside xylohydrolase
VTASKELGQLAETGSYLVRRLTRVQAAEDGIISNLAGVRFLQVDEHLGVLTGESPQVQSLETLVPNFPDLSIVPLDLRELELRISVVAHDVIRLVFGPSGHPDLRGDGTKLGIVVDPRPDPISPAVDITDDQVTVTTPALTLQVRRQPFAFSISDGTGRLVARSADRLRQCLGLPLAPGLVAEPQLARIALELAADEDIVGFGEQFGRLVKNGQRLRLRCEDALGPGTGLAYKPVPVWHSSSGYLGFVNTGSVVVADVGATLPGVLSVSVEDDVLDLYLVISRDPKARLTRYTDLTGRARGVPPAWAFGYWMSRCRYRTRAELEEAGRGMREHDVPCDVLHIDPDWLILDRLNTDWRWSEDKFPNPAGMIRELSEQGFHVSVWELPYIDSASPIYSQAAAQGYLVRRTDGSPAGVAGTPTRDGRPRGLVDFTNPAARDWWQRNHEPYLQMGVAAYKTDFGEGLPDECALADGATGKQRHNLYPLLYNGAVYEAIYRFTGRTPLVWGRSGWAGSHRYPAQWGGDSESTVAGMYSTLRGGLSFAMSAPGLWSHDIGGFFGPELTPELYVRWTQFGCFSPLARAHGLRPREPWVFGTDALAIVRDYVKLRYRLLPHLRSIAAESLSCGWPMLRPLGLEFPEDPAARIVDTAFLLGQDLLVAPVFDDRPEPVKMSVYLPEGRWADFWTGVVVDGGRAVQLEAPLHLMPVFVRAGAVLLTGPVGSHTGEIADAPWTLLAFPGADRTSIVHDETGDRWTLRFRDGEPPTLRLSGPPRPVDGAVLRRDGEDTRLALEVVETRS